MEVDWTSLHKVYLSAYSMGLGASGSTFYDDAVTDFFSPHARGKATVIAVGVGVPAYKARVRGLLHNFRTTNRNAYYLSRHVTSHV